MHADWISKYRKFQNAWLKYSADYSNRTAFRGFRFYMLIWKPRSWGQDGTHYIKATQPNAASRRTDLGFHCAPSQLHRQDHLSWFLLEPWPIRIDQKKSLLSYSAILSHKETMWSSTTAIYCTKGHLLIPCSWQLILSLRMTGTDPLLWNAAYAAFTFVLHSFTPGMVLHEHIFHKLKCWLSALLRKHYAH